MSGSTGWCDFPYLWSKKQDTPWDVHAYEWIHDSRAVFVSREEVGRNPSETNSEKKMVLLLLLLLEISGSFACVYLKVLEFLCFAIMLIH